MSHSNNARLSQLKRRRKRVGVASVIAMMFLILFATLALGFFASATTSVQIARNEQNVSRAFLAAESGMQFIRYQLRNVSIPYDTDPDELFDTLYVDLADMLEGTANMGAHVVGVSDDAISIPEAADEYIALDDDGGSKFRVEIERDADRLNVKVIGRYGDTDVVARAIQVQFGIAENASAIFDYGIASRGRIVTAGSSRIKGATDPTKGSLLSTNMTEEYPVVIGGKEVSGDISITNPSGKITYSGASVGGTTDPALIAANHIHKGVSEPEFPAIDTDVFAAYATNAYVAGQAVYTNVRIPPNTNPKFAGGTKFKGVLYIEKPNSVEFRGSADVQGVIVVDNTNHGSLSTNVIDFSGNSASIKGVETLDSSFGGLRNLTGSFILAPGFHVKFQGSFGSVNGSIISSQLTMSGNAGGTINGTVINVEDNAVSLNGSSEIIIASTGTTNYPSGVHFGSHYVPLPDTYEEVQP